MKYSDGTELTCEGESYHVYIPREIIGVGRPFREGRDGHGCVTLGGYFPSEEDAMSAMRQLHVGPFFVEQPVDGWPRMVPQLADCFS